MATRRKHHAWPGTLNLAVASGLISPEQAEQLWEHARATTPQDAQSELRREALRLGLLSEAEFDYLAALAERVPIAEAPTPPTSRWSIVRTAITLAFSLALLAAAIAAAAWVYLSFYPRRGTAPEASRTPPSQALDRQAEEARQALESADRFARSHPHSTDHIRQYYELVIRHFPGSPEAETARTRLEELLQSGTLASLAVSPAAPDESPVATVPEPPVAGASPEVLTGVEELPEAVVGRQPEREPEREWGTAEQSGNVGQDTVPIVEPVPGSVQPVRTAPLATLRRLFAQGPQRCYIAISCDGRYVLYVNGREVGRGVNPAPSRSVGGLSMDLYQCRLKEGDEITVQAEARLNSGALFVEVFVEPHGVSFGTDSTWQYRQPRAADAPAQEADWRPARIVELYGGRTRGSPGELVEPVGNWIWGEGKRLVFRKIVRF